VKKIILLFACSVGLFGQQFRSSNQDPVGSCTSDVVFNFINGKLWGCINGSWSNLVASGGGLSVGVTGITGGTNGRVLYDNSAILGELSILSRSIGGTNNTAGATPQLFFGTAAPGSISGNLPGDLFSDTTNHNDYWCNAPSGTAAPACTAVTTGGWTILNGGGGGSGTGATYVGVLSGIPATCTLGQYALITDATVGEQFYTCTATNTWIQQWTPLPGSCVTLSFNPTTAAETFSVDPNCTLSSPTPGATPNLNTNGSQKLAIAVCTTTCTVTVPVPAHDFQFCVMNDDNVSTVITMSALGSSARYENTGRTAYGTAGTGTFVSGGAVGDMVCIYGRDTTHYLTTTFKGTWTAN